MHATSVSRRSFPIAALRPFLVVMLLLTTAAATAQVFGPPDPNTLPGDYELVNLTGNSLQAPPPIPTVGSLKVATLDVYVSFQCPHCQAFYPYESILQQRYGARLVIRRHYLALTENALNEDLRLYLVARDAGKGPEAADLLMKAGLDEHDGHQRLAACAHVAEQLGLAKGYEAALRDPQMIRRIHQLDADSTFVTATPTLILNDRLSFGGDLHNAETILDAALKVSSAGAGARR
ncbi:DsbA family protein [Rhodanobacter sp. FW106-PBR-LB-2-11]|uniref:DsbA family protein n=1 Tax=Rhodanobacter sp. FW106-PBR-LB-2-11 TaxID=1524463 RepID=UPI0034E61C63